MANEIYKYPISYNGNVLWPVLFLLLFPPLGIILLILNTSVIQEGVSYSLNYRGSQFWLIFWSIVFFPVAVVLGFITGFDVIGKKLLS